MQKERINSLIVRLRKFEMTGAEKDFVSFAETNVELKGPLADMVESTLAGIYRKKTEFIRSSIFLMIDQNKGIAPRM
jgi:hypothetical protein